MNLAGTSAPAKDGGVLRGGKLRRLRWCPSGSRRSRERSPHPNATGANVDMSLRSSICARASTRTRYTAQRRGSICRGRDRGKICATPIDKSLILIYNKSVEIVGRRPRRAHLRVRRISASGREPKKRPRFCRPTQKNSFFSKNSVTFRNFCRLIG